VIPEQNPKAETVVRKGGGVGGGSIVVDRG
jgi:hypothetical protein